MRWPLSHTKTALLAVFLCSVCVIGILAYRALTAKPTYIKIVDQASIARDNSTSPGADIRGISLTHEEKSEKYVTAVVSFTPKNLSTTSLNEFTNANSVIGDFHTQKNPSHVALSSEGELVVRIDATYHSSDVITIYEIGQKQGRTAEYYEVSISKTEQGPWTVLGTGAGETRFIIP